MNRKKSIFLMAVGALILIAVIFLGFEILDFFSQMVVLLLPLLIPLFIMTFLICLIFLFNSIKKYLK